MQQNQQPVTMGNSAALVFAILTIVGMKYGFASNPEWYKLAYISFPMLVVSVVFFRGK